MQLGVISKTYIMNISVFLETVPVIMLPPNSIILKLIGFTLGVEMYKYWSSETTELEPDRGGM